MPWPLYSPCQNSPTYLLPLLKNRSPKVQRLELRQQPRQMGLIYKLFTPETSAFSACDLKARPCSSPLPLQYPTVSSLWSYLTCIFSGFQKVSSKACSCFTPTTLVIAFLLKTSSLFLRFKCRIFSTTTPFSKYSSCSFMLSQSMRKPEPLERWVVSLKGILMMCLPTLKAISYQVWLLWTMDVIEFSRKMMLWPEGESWQYSVITEAPSSCRSSPFPCFWEEDMPPMQTALLQWQKFLYEFPESFSGRYGSSLSLLQSISSRVLVLFGENPRLMVQYQKYYRQMTTPLINQFVQGQYFSCI